MLGQNSKRYIDSLVKVGFSEEEVEEIVRYVSF